jgi:hypothetical protein
MSQLIRIIYISRSTFKSQSHAVIEPNVGRILTQSRINNRRNNLVGVLYFGDGCFFQCLEGEKSAVDRLWSRLQSDPRHKDVKLLSSEPISQVTYEEWAMKFVPLDSQMKQVLNEGGLKKFDPYRFDKAMVQKVMDLLRTFNNPTTDAEVETLIKKAVAAPVVNQKERSLWPFALVAVLLAATAMFLLLR